MVSFVALRESAGFPREPIEKENRTVALKSRTELTDELTTLKLEYDKFRADVAKVAVAAKNENGWCDAGFVRAMESLGLTKDLPKGTRRVTLVYDVELDHESGWDFAAMDDSDWVEAALDQIRENYTTVYELVSSEVDEVPQDN
jgi:hypothetical protein